MKIQENINNIRARIERACERAGRKPDEVQLVGVSKTVDSGRIQEALDAGITIIGENRVQEAWDKFQTIGTRARWHMIGHLQTNKVKRTLEFADMIQSVDSVRVAREIQKQAEKMDRTMDVLVEINTSGEASKFGFQPDETTAAIREMAQLDRLKVKGLMTIGVFSPNPEEVRPGFALLRDLARRVADRQIAGVDMEILSMGMTDDFELAIAEGSTMVRIGRAIFGERPDSFEN